MRGIRHEGDPSRHLAIGQRRGATPPRLQSPQEARQYRKAGRALWRQPMMLGFIVLLMGCGGAGGWWAWREGWLVEAQIQLEAMSRNIAGAITPFKLPT
jgi:cell division protein FtsQ